MYKHVWYCRWCGITYWPQNKTERDGFCSSKHKQAHYRAYKKYVTLQAHESPGAQRYRVTAKKQKKRQCDTCSANPDGCALWKNPKVQGCKRYLKKRKKRK